MAWVTSTDLGYAIGSGQVTALGLGDATTYAQFELQARATVVAVTQHAGYAAFEDTLTAGEVSTGFLQKLIIAVLARDAYASRKGIALPSQTSEMITSGLSMLDAVYSKSLPIPGLEPDTLGGIGGVKFSPTTGDSARARVFAFRGTSF
jgi:hypothetical protein